MSTLRRQPAAVAIGLAGALVAPASALAATRPTAPLALLGLPSVGEIVEKVVDGFFGALLKAITPDFLTDAGVDALRWLVALPNPADAQQWPTIHTLQVDLTYVGLGLLPATLTLTAARYWAAGYTGADVHAGHAVTRAAGATAALAVYAWAFDQAIAAVNIVTDAILHLPVVAHGMDRSAQVLFGGALLTGTGGVLLAILGIVAVVLAIGLYLVKIALLVLCGLWFAAGGLILALFPLPEAHALWRTWRFGLVALAAIPVGWCLLFALSGALLLDATNVGAGAGIDSKLTAVFAAIITFYLALRWPFWLLRAVPGHLSALPGASAIRPTGGSGGGGSAQPARALTARAQLARATFAAAGTINSTAARAWNASPARHVAPASALRGGLTGIGARAAGSATHAAAAATGNPSLQAAAGHAQRIAGATGQRARAAIHGGRETLTAGGGLTDAALAAANSAVRPQSPPPAKTPRPAATAPGGRARPQRRSQRPTTPTASQRPNNHLGASTPAATPPPAPGPAPAAPAASGLPLAPASRPPERKPPASKRRPRTPRQAGER